MHFSLCPVHEWSVVDDVDAIGAFVSPYSTILHISPLARGAPLYNNRYYYYELDT